MRLFDFNVSQFYDKRAGSMERVEHTPAMLPVFVLKEFTLFHHNVSTF